MDRFEKNLHLLIVVLIVIVTVSQVAKCVL